MMHRAEIQWMVIYASAMTGRSFSHVSTTEDVLEGLDLEGQTFLVTGSSGGLGLETCRALANHGAAVIMAARDQEKNEAARQSILSVVPQADLVSVVVDLGSLASVKAAAQGIMASGRSLQGLILNAGIMATPFSRTVDGFESQFGVDHLGHFCLAWHLLPRLVESAPARVVIVSSAGHRMGDVDLEDLNFERRAYDPLMAYGAAKTCNVLHAVALDHLYRAQGVRAFAVHPGGIHTELGRYMTPEVISSLLKRIEESEAPTPRGAGAKNEGSGFQWKSIPQGAATTVWAATAPELEGRGGEYCEDCSVSPVLPEQSSSSSATVNGAGVAARAVDRQRALALWELSVALIGE